jgi:hypothetical protein
LEEDEVATRELINWGILERNSVNEVLPTANFLVWLYEQKGNLFADLEQYQDATAKEHYEFLEDEVRNAIHTWTSQNVRGRITVDYNFQEVEVHIKTVCKIITEISDRLFEAHEIRTKIRGTEEERKVWAKEIKDECSSYFEELERREDRKQEMAEQQKRREERRKGEAAKHPRKIDNF